MSKTMVAIPFVLEELNRLGNQIVIRVADDFDPGKFANRQSAAQVNPPVNVRRVGFTAGDEVVLNFEL